MTPAFMSDCSPIPLPPEPAQAWDVLAFDNQHQERTNWCWAAVAASVARFYDSHSAFTQCSIASGELHLNCACTGDIPKEDPCNVYGYLMSSLFRVGHFDKWVARQPATFDQVYEEITHARPLCARIVWYGGGAHLVTITGYADVDVSGVSDGLAVADPWWGESDIDFEDFPKGYINCGSCTDNYYTAR